MDFGFNGRRFDMGSAVGCVLWAEHSARGVLPFRLIFTVSFRVDLVG